MTKEEGIRPSTVNPRFIILTPFKNKMGKIDKVPILNFDGHLDIAHQMGLVSLTSDIVKEWEVSVPAGLDENDQPRMETIHWIQVKATAVVMGPNGRQITATGHNSSNDRDKFIRKQEHLLAVSETRAMKRALYNACGITEAMYNPDGKEATREAVDLPLHMGDEDEPEGIPKEIRKKPDISPPLTTRTTTHPSEGSSGKSFEIDF